MPSSFSSYDVKFAPWFLGLVSSTQTCNLIPFLLKKVALNPKLNQSDGIHPNYEGAKVISETIRESIINLD